MVQYVVREQYVVKEQYGGVIKTFHDKNEARDFATLLNETYQAGKDIGKYEGQKEAIEVAKKVAQTL